AGQDVGIDLLIGADLIERAARRATGEPGRQLRAIARRLREDAEAGGARPEAADAALEPEPGRSLDQSPDRRVGVGYGRAAGAARVDTPQSIRRSGRWRTSTGWSRPQGDGAWRSHSISPSSAPPIIPLSRSIPSGSGAVPMDPCSTRRTRRRSTRTSIRWTS